MDKLERDGFLLVRGALDSTTVSAWRAQQRVLESYGNEAYARKLLAFVN